MAESGVERLWRAASRPVPSGSTLRRFAVRALVVAGFAGAAWLLSASAAQAQAEPTPSTADTVAVRNDGASVRDAVSTAAEPVVGAASALLRPVVAGSDPASTVTLPSDADRPGRPGPASGATGKPAGTGAPAVPADVTGVADTGGSAPDHRTTPEAPAAPGRLTTSDAPGLVGLAQGLAQPLGLDRAVTGPATVLAPLARAADPVVAPLTSPLRPVTDALRSAAAPVLGALDPVTRPVADVVSRAMGSAVTVDPSNPPTTATTSRSTAYAAHSVRTAGGAAHQGTAVGNHSASTAEQRPAGAESAPDPVLVPAGSTGTDDLPVQHLPAPLRGYPGAGSGISTFGSGPHTDGGSFAVVPMTVAGSTGDSHRLPVATGVEVPWLVAMDPTVSPD